MNSFPYLLGKTNKVLPTRRPRPNLPHHYERPRLMYFLFRNRTLLPATVPGQFYSGPAVRL